LTVRSTSFKVYRSCAILTLFVCLFWNTVGISTHNHDLLGDGYTAHVNVHGSSSPIQSIHARGYRSATEVEDTCPGCSFDAACVSGAVAALIVPPAPRATIMANAMRVRRPSASLFGLASRGPPAA